MRVVGIIQGRTASSRLPSKILAPVVPATPLIEVLAARIRSVPIEWWLATTEHRSDDVLAQWATDLGLNVLRGDENDVLSRFVAISELTGCEWIVRATGDDPFTDSGIVERLIDQAGGASPEVTVVGDLQQHLPLGYVPQIVRAEALLASLDHLADDDHFHRAHVTSALLAAGGEQLDLGTLSPRPRLRWTVDTQEDFRMARAVFEILGDDWSTAGYGTLLDVCDSNPEIVAINAAIEQKRIEDG